MRSYLKWPIVESLVETVGSNATAAVYGPLKIMSPELESKRICRLLIKPVRISCPVSRNERRARTTFQALFTSVDDTPVGKIRPCGRFIENRKGFLS